MKKFSVLLIVVLFFVPVFVYGLTGSSLTKPIGLINSMKKFAPVAKIFSIGKTEKMSPKSFDPILSDDPYFPSPNGIRGKIVEINPSEKMIFLKDAVYFNEAKQVFEQADFRIYCNPETEFYVDLAPNGTFESLLIGDEVISKGTFSLTDHTSKFSVALYKGSFVNPEEKRAVEFAGIVTELDPTNFSFILPGPRNLKVSLNENTLCFESVIQDKAEIVTPLGLKVIPAWVKEGTRIRGTIFVTPNATDVTAGIIYFSKE